MTFVTLISVCVSKPRSIRETAKKFLVARPLRERGWGGQGLVTKKKSSRKKSLQKCGHQARGEGRGGKALVAGPLKKRTLFFCDFPNGVAKTAYRQASYRLQCNDKDWQLITDRWIHLRPGQLGGTLLGRFDTAQRALEPPCRYHCYSTIYFLPGSSPCYHV